MVWKRIYDDEIAHFGNQISVFASPMGSYKLEIAEARQETVSMISETSVENWPVQRKEQKGEHFRLSGMAWKTTELALSDTYWFVLTICEKPQIEFWGDQILFRKDVAAI